jgi:starch synthase
MADALRIVLVASEVVPFAKTGGLADVAGSLPKALASLGHQVSIFMPRYPSVERAVRSLEKVHPDLEVPMGADAERGIIWRSRLAPRVLVYFVEHEGFFQRDSLYTTPNGDYPDNAERFTFFAKAVLETCRALDLQPDLIHCHDWQAALIPAYLKTTLQHDPQFAQVGSLLTIHNLAYQGLFPAQVMEFLGLPPETYAIDGIEYYGGVNFLKAGIIYADLINTVSWRYSQEIQTPELGHGLDGILRYRAQDVYGILNGVDYREWAPAVDRLIAARYTAENLAGKQVCKRDLLQAFQLPLDLMRSPLVGIISRLVDQKGFDLVRSAIHRMLALDLGLVVLGVGDAQYETFLREVAHRYPTKVGVRIGFDNTLAHQIEAGSDIFLMPSRFEPCGLNQIYSLKYGTIPLVRATGGLDDTIEAYDPASDDGNGFKFGPYDAEALLATLQEALMVYRDRSAWERLMRRAMQADFSWTRSAHEYVALYTRALAIRRGGHVFA